MSADASPISRSGRVGRMIPASVSVTRVWILLVTCFWSHIARGILSRLGQRQTRWFLPVLDQSPDVSRAARVEEHVALSDARLLGQQARLQQRLADGVGELAVVALEP